MSPNVRCAILCLVVCSAAASPTPSPCSFTVDGNATTLFDAQTFVRAEFAELRRNGKPLSPTPIVVCLAAGTRHDVSRTTLTFSGVNDSGPVVWRGLGDGVMVSGGVQLTDWSATSLGGGAAFVAAAPDGVLRTLWVAGRRASRASVQNVTALLGAMTPWHSADGTSVGFTLAGGGAAVPPSWLLNNTRLIEFVWPIVIANWIEPRCCVGSIEGNNITLVAPCGHFLLARNVYAPTLSPPISAEAVPAFPLAAGTFYHDAANRLIYYALAAGESEAALQADAWASTQEVLVSYVNVSGHAWEGVQFSYGTWNQAHSTDGFVESQSAVFACTVGSPSCVMGGQPAASSIPSAAAAGQGEPRGNVRVSHCSDVSFTACNFTRLAAPYALSIMEGSRNVSVSRCVFSDLSGGFLKLGSVSDTPGGSGDRSLWDAGAVIVDNSATNQALEYQGAAAFFGGYVRDLQLSHNDIHSAGYSGVSLGWGWGADFPPGYGNNTVSFNSISHVMTRLRDGGGIYVNGATSNDTTSLMANNWVDADEAVFAVFYLDNGASEWGMVTALLR